MNFTDWEFIPFIVATLIIYYITPRRFRYVVIVAFSYLFYALENAKNVFVLFTVTLITYIGGLVIGKYKKKSIFRLFFWVNLGMLFVLKYLDFAQEWIDFIITQVGVGYIVPRKSLNIVAPIGLSFYVFQSTNYLNEIYRKDLEVEKNFIRYAAYVAFFPAILSGPIQKARELLPQLKETKDFDSEYFIRAFLLFIWGYLEKVFIANKLRTIVDLYWDNYEKQSGVYPLIAAISFSLYIYSDFSAYSDMACGTARMLGFKIQNNFNNPYLATSLSSFWNRWHMTLNDWFIENVYIPLGGNRKGCFRKYINVMIVFLFSGAWHGASMHFVIWGGINGLLQIIGQILEPAKKKFYTLLGIDYRCFSIRMLKRLGVFFFITLTWVFFRAPGTSAALSVIKSIFSVRTIEIFNPDLFGVCGDVTKTFLCIFAIIIFIIVQIHRKDTGKYYLAFRRQPIVFQTLLCGFAIFIIVMASLAGHSDINTQFVYFQF